MPVRSKLERPRIDIHSHVMPPAIFGQAGPYGPELLFEDDGTMVIRVGDYRLRADIVGKKEEAARIGPKAWREKQLAGFGDAATRLAELDVQDIDVMGVTIPPLFYLYNIEPDIAVDFARAANKALSDYCALAPKRLFFMASLPLQDIDASIDEVGRSVALGARGVNIGGRDLAGKQLYSEEMWPLYAALEKYDLPLFIHPYPTEIADGKAPDRYTPLILDYPFECTKAVNNLILGGVFDDFPNLKVYVSHGGGFIPYQFGRIETFALLNKQVKAKKPPREYLGNFYFDTLIHELDARKYLVEWMGSDNLVVGDNHGGMDSADGFAFVDEMGLDEVSADKIKGGNARKLFKLDEHLV